MYINAALYLDLLIHIRHHVALSPEDQICWDSLCSDNSPYKDVFYDIIVIFADVDIIML